jgi:ORF6N domain
MLDKDLAELYNVMTRNLNKAVNRNLKRFPKDFMFQLNQKEFKNLMFQFGTSSWVVQEKCPTLLPSKE